MPSLRFALSALAALTLSGCATTVLQQRVPISSQPAGATAQNDAGDRCTTPCALDLDRNRDHIVTLTLPGYETQDVEVRRQYRTTDVLLSVINSGLQSAQTFKNAGWAMQSGMSSKAAMESSGAAYTLEPSTISLRLRPDSGYAPSTTSAHARAALGNPRNPFALLAPNDEHLLESALENTPTGQTTGWNNPQTGLQFAVQADNVEIRQGQVVRPFVLSVMERGQATSGRYTAMRAGRGEWQIITADLATDALVPLGNPVRPAIAPTRPASDTLPSGAAPDAVIRTLDALNAPR